MQPTIPSFLVYIVFIVLASTVGYILYSQHAEIKTLRLHPQELIAEKNEIVRLFKESKEQWQHHKKTYDDTIQIMEKQTQQLLGKVTLFQRDMNALNERYKQQNAALEKMDTQNNELKAKAKCPTPLLSEWEQRDYHRLMLEVLLQQKLHRYLWRPQDKRELQKVVILTDLHNPKIKNDEPLIALQANLLNHFVEEVHLLVETNDKDQDMTVLKNLVNSHKIHTFNMTKRWTPGDAFQYVNNNKALHGKIVIMTNNDIIFDYTLINMREFPIAQKNVMWAISRRRTTFDGRRGVPPIPHIEVHPDMCWSYVGSHDGYVFRPPVAQHIVSDTGDFYLGEWGCENRILHAFQHAGYSLLNPCWKFNLWHYSTAYYQKKTNRRVSHGKSTISHPHTPDQDLGIEFGWPAGITAREQDLSGL